MTALLVFVAGAAAVIYELAWMRQLAPVLGAGAAQAAIVGGAIFVGLAVGGGSGGMLARRLRRPLVGYAIAQIVAAAWVVVLPHVQEELASDGIARALVDASPSTSVLMRGGIALGILLPGTIAIGASLPLIAAHVRGGIATASAFATGLAGAAVGAIAWTFVLLDAIGAMRSAWIAAIGAAAAAAVAIAAGRRPVEPSDDDGGPARVAGWPIYVAAMAGALIAIAHVLYARMLGLTFHGSAYTIGAASIAFWLALAGGAAIAVRRARRGGDAKRWAAGCSATAALLVPISIVALWAITGFAPFAAGDSFASYVAGALAIVVLVVGPPVAAMGALLPVAIIAAGTRRVGLLVLAHAAAAAMATFATAFVVVPGVGVWAGFGLVALAYLATAIAMSPPSTTPSRIAVVAATLAVAGAVVLLRPRGPTRSGERVVERVESSAGWIDVVEDARGNRRLRRDLHHGVVDSQNVVVHRRLGVVPVLVHPSPRRVLIVGLGTGIVVGAALDDARVERVEIVEPVAEVDAIARWFERWNGGLAGDDRARVAIADPRLWLRGRAGPWDVVIGDVVEPWQAGASVRYSIEHQRAIATRLAPGGTYWQWFSLRHVGRRELALVADTTRAVFPHVTLWRGETSRQWGVIAIVGSHEPIVVDGVELAARATSLRPQVDKPDVALARPRDLVALYAGDWPRRVGAPIITDDRPRLELSAAVTSRAGDVLTHDRLVGFYRDVVLPLQRASVTYAPSADDRPWNAIEGVRMQMGAAGADGTP